MAEIDPREAEIQIAELLRARLPNPVRIVHFDSGSEAARQQKRFLEALAQLSDRLALEVRDLDKDADLARDLGIDKAPATAVLGAKDHGIRFYGLTAGYEFASFLEAILMASSGLSGLEPELERWAGGIATSTHLEILVTLTCPYCPQMVHIAHQLAVANESIRADMVDAAEFPELARRYGLGGVPLTVVNGRRAFEGALPPGEAVLEILKIAAPAAYEALEVELREASGARKARRAEPGHTYDVIVVGAGPAALSAAIYATRKALDVALIGDRLGGQVNDTASIENWLGATAVGGQDLAALFRAHVENYALAEKLRTRVEAVERDGADFVVRTPEGETYRARTVVYCAGKEYRKLNVPGEDRFLGRGIAFCATCDAPLYQGRRVAVVGGGNSAFTAARDLLPYASEIHIINIAPDFQADAILFAEVGQNPKVRLHPSTQVLEFIGDDRVTGVRLAPVEGGAPLDLAVDGAFLEIGLVPNSKPVAGLVELNAEGEVPVGRDQSTAVPGFFAAGDVTDEPEKQIVVAEGAGAKAGLSAYNFLVSRGHKARGAAW